MADKLPYFRWFPKDAETSEAYASMTNEQLGFYHRCLNRSWLNDGLPSDPGERARSLQHPQKLADRLWEVVGRRFYLDNGRYRNPRQEEERTKAQTKSDQSSDAVRERERKRMLRSSDDASDDKTNDDPRAQARPGSGSGSSEETTTTTEKPSTRKKLSRSEASPEFEEFYAAFWLKKAWPNAWRAYREHVTTPALHVLVMQAVDAQKPEMFSRDPSKRPYPATWLNAHGWKDEIVSGNGAKSKAERLFDSI